MTLAHTLMVQGTGSGVGKSWLVTALCRLFARRGICVLPFKAQNMSNNAAVTAAGAELGRAQAVQAMAAGVEPDERMNPVLLKPLVDIRSDVVLLGRSRPDLARIPWRERRDVLWEPVTQALGSLRRECDLLMIEGAGSPAEPNLRAGDIVNMAIARACGAPVLLVADIDRGGAFASLFGTWALLDAEDRSHMKGFVLNRFRGDPSLLSPAPEDLTVRTGVPVLGVIPFVPHGLPEEDAVSLERDGASGGESKEVREESVIRVAAIHFPRIANFDDLAPLQDVTGVAVDWVRSPRELTGANAVVLPGTRNTPEDLCWLRKTGLASAVCRLAAQRVPVLGICGGFQMLGDWIEDPNGLERVGSRPGLGLLPVRTRLEPTKTTRRTSARVACGAYGLDCPTVTGYEIHHGRTILEGSARVWMVSDDVPTRPLGVQRGSVAGTYLHGLFGNDAFRRAWLAQIGCAAIGEPWSDRIEATFETLADVVEASVGIEALLRIIHAGAP